MPSVDLAKLVSTQTTLTKSDIRVASVLSQHVDRWGEVRVMQPQIMEEASVSQATLTRSLRRLEEVNFISTTRVRKEFNRYGKNRYTVMDEYFSAEGPADEPSPVRAGWPETPIAHINDAPTPAVKLVKQSNALVLTDEQSTASPVSSNDSNNQVITSTNYVTTKNYLKSGQGLRPSSSEMSNGEEPESKPAINKPISSATPKDNSAPSNKTVTSGWGTAKQQRAAGLGATHWKTRFLRGTATWSAWDISAEFQVLLNEESGHTVGKVDGSRIRGIVNKLRKERGSFAELEAHVIRKIARNILTLNPIKEDVGAAPGVFYNVLTEYIDLWWEADDPERWKSEFIELQQCYDQLFKESDLNRVDRAEEHGRLIMDLDIETTYGDLRPEKYGYALTV